MGGKNSKPITSVTQSRFADAPIDSTTAVGGNTGSNYETEMVANVIGNVAEYLFSEERLTYAVISQSHPDHIFGYREPRNVRITKKLLSAVAYGMESREVNVDPKPKDLFAKDLLIKSPEFLLARAHLTDWAGRTFTGRITENHPEGEGITAFEYALWAKDFKMLDMMLSCMPITSAGDEIRGALFEQYNQVKAPIEAGGGLIYTLAYDRPDEDAQGIPIMDAAGVFQMTLVTEAHTENHFDVTPLLRAYQDYNANIDGRTWMQSYVCWIKIIGTLQRLLPIHILQRYCDPGTPFFPVPTFTGAFQRTNQLFHYHLGRQESFLSSSLSVDFSVVRGCLGGGARGGQLAHRCVELLDLDAIHLVDKVSTNEIETKIKQRLTYPSQSQTQFRF